jgi:hypothetical protein
MGGKAEGEAMSSGEREAFETEIAELKEWVRELRMEKVTGLRGGIAAIQEVTGRNPDGFEYARTWARAAMRAIQEELKKAPLE